MRFSFLVLVFLLFTFRCVGQGQYLSKGDFYFEKGEYNLAQLNYETYIEEVPNDLRVNLKLMEIYLNDFNLKAAKKSYEALDASLFKANYKHRFLEARYHHLTGNYKLALKLFHNLNKVHRSHEVDILMGQCIYALKLKKKSIEVKPFCLEGVDSSNHNLFPVFNANEDSFIYSSDQGSQTGKTQIIQVYEESSLPIRVLNDSIFSSVCVGASPDFNLLFIYKGINGGDLFYSTYNKNNYTVPKPFEFNTKDKESAVTISPDGNQIIFVREKEGSSDLYTSTLSDDSVWSTPVLFELNSPNNERTPFFHPSGQLLFYSVDGTQSIGGYDVVYSRKEEGKWSRPTNLGTYINSPGDELGFSLFLSGHKAVYSTNNKNGKQSLRGVELYPSFEQDYMHLKGVLINEDSIGIEAKIYLRNLDDGHLIRSFKSKTTGEFSFVFDREGEYSLQVLAQGYQFISVKLSVNFNQQKECFKRIMLSRVKSLPTILENIQFKSKSDQLFQNSFYELDNLVDYLKQNSTLQAEIVGHTDNIGDDQFNKELSLSRANAVKNYLIVNGISSSRIAARGVGSISPLFPNDTELNRALNRRVEVMFK